jgi:hypothetical protein
VARLFSRYFPLVAWLLFISFASSDNFNAGNTSRIIGPLILWLFPDTSIETLGLVHLITRKAAHFTEYAILAFFAARAFRTSPRPSIANRWFLISLALVIVYARRVPPKLRSFPHRHDLRQPNRHRWWSNRAAAHPPPPQNRTALQLIPPSQRIIQPD